MLCICCILILDRAVNQRCTYGNKRKKKRKQVDVTKEYMQVPAAVESVGDRKARVTDSLQTEGSATPDCATLAMMGEKCCYGQERSWVNIAVCPCLPHLSHTTETSTISRIKWERYIFL